MSDLYDERTSAETGQLIGLSHLVVGEIRRDKENLLITGHVVEVATGGFAGTGEVRIPLTKEVKEIIQGDLGSLAKEEKDTQADEWFDKAEDCAAFKSWKPAKGYLLKIIDRGRGRVLDALTRLGAVERILENDEASLKVLSQAIEMKPDHMEAYFQRGMTYYCLEQWEKALEDYETADGLTLLGAGAFSYWMGMTKYHLGRIEEAERNLNWAIDFQGYEEKDAFINLAVIRNKLELYRDTIDIVNEGLEKHSSSAKLYNTRGIAYFYLGNYKKAIEDFEKAEFHKPESAKYKRNIGEVYEKIGNMDKAREYWKKAIKADPDSSDAKKAEESLKKK